MRLQWLGYWLAALMVVGCGDAADVAGGEGGNGASAGIGGDAGAGGDAGTGGSAGLGGQGGTGGDRSLGFTELYDAGLTRFVGVNAPENPDEPPTVNGMRRFTFDPDAGGPLCLRGGSYNVQTRDGDGDELLIFLQGGGGCWNALCSAEDDADAVPLLSVGVLGTSEAQNPMHDWDVVYLPYCDGSLFAGDTDRMRIDPMTNDPIEMVYQRGLANLTAALDIAKRLYPNPSRIMLAGISGGAFGTFTATPLVRYYYPRADMMVFNDSGIGVAKDGDPAFVEGLLTEWNASDLIPESCTNCTQEGHITQLLDWALEADPTLRISALSFTRDSTIANTFLQIDPAMFETVLLRETERTATAFPDRFRRFILPGSKHTVLLDAGLFIPSLGGLDDTANGVTVRSFLFGMVDETQDWVSQVDLGPQ